jgi:toxin YoeB
MKLSFEDSSALEGFFTIAEDRKLLKQLKKILRDIDRTPFTGIGKPERLKGRPGEWSRRIDQYHRLIYKIENDEVIIVECGGHYEG